MKRVAIVIPIYKDDVDIESRISLESLGKNLIKPTENKDVWFLTHDGVDISEHQKILNEYGIEVYRKDFDWTYFQGQATYSDLCKSYNFYDAFSDYEYMLIFQTDVYMVHDDIDYWCDQHYDYIGAPIIATDANWDNVPTTGNGGCSLRNISTFKLITHPNGLIYKDYKDVIDEAVREKPKYGSAEDLFFCELVYKYFDFSKPKHNVAWYFAYDMNAEHVWKFSNHAMPSFIHAFGRNQRFWQFVIDDINDERLISYREWIDRNVFYAPNSNYQGKIEGFDRGVVTGCITYVDDNNVPDIQSLLDIGICEVTVIDYCTIGNEFDIGNKWKNQVRVIRKNSTSNKFESDLKDVYKEIDDRIEFVTILRPTEKIQEVPYTTLKSTDKQCLPYYAKSSKRMWLKTKISKINLSSIIPDSYKSITKDNSLLDVPDSEVKIG